MRSLAYLALVLSACTTTQSDDVLTSGIHAQLSAATFGDGETTVSATLFVGNPIGLNYVELAGDDRLVAKHGTTSKPMIESELLNTVTHRAVFDGDAEGDQFEVSFTRAVDEGAPSSRMTLPAKFDLAAPPATASRAQSLTLTWSPAGSSDAMSWDAEGDCIEREGAPITGDPGTLTIAGDIIKKRMAANTPDQCTVTLIVKRSKRGTLDPNYGEGGSVGGIQQRKVTFTSMP